MIPIFQYENQDEIAELVRSSGSISYAHSIKPVTLDESQLQQFKQMIDANASANPNQFDLFYLESVLASAGWNNNDDVFDPHEVWSARNTPVDKQFNFMHNETDIIGHLTSSKIVDHNGRTISSEENLPDQFDIVVGSVLYRKWADPKLQERMNQIIADIMENKWCVSMECLFSNFDYAVKTPDNQHKIIARNDETSFLTKHLRVYGGTGVYSDYKIGRLLRGFSFSGKGLVDNPANPRSKITNYNDKNEISSFTGAAATVEELEISNDVQENPMPISQEQYDALKAELEALKTSKAKEAQKELDDARATITDLETKVSELTSELDASKEIANAKDESIQASKTELDDLKAKLTEAEEKIANQELEKTKSARKNQLLTKVDEEKANLLVEKFANASDEMFEALFESLPAKKKDYDDEEGDVPGEQDTGPDEKDKKKKSKSSDEGVDTDIDDATASDDADMTGDSTDDVPVDKIAKASSWFTDHVLRATAKKQGE